MSSMLMTIKMQANFYFLTYHLMSYERAWKTTITVLFCIIFKNVIRALCVQKSSHRQTWGLIAGCSHTHVSSWSMSGESQAPARAMMITSYQETGFQSRHSGVCSTSLFCGLSKGNASLLTIFLLKYKRTTLIPYAPMVLRLAASCSVPFCSN